MSVSKWFSVILIVPQVLVAAPKGYNATVSGDVADCVKDVKKVRGVSSVSGLEAIGIITFKASKAAAGKVAALDCIDTVEEDQEVFTQGDDDCTSQLGE